MEISVPEYSRDKDRGQVGIETLIVFIAMILVAAIAASVLINTAGYLQNQASETSQDSEDQVSNQVLIISSIGDIQQTETDAGWTDGEELTIQLNADSGNELTVESGNGFDWAPLYVSSSDSELQATWGDNSAAFNDGDLDELEEGDTVSVAFGTNEVVLQVPDTGEVDDELTIEETNQINGVSMTVMQSPGADEIDLEGASVEYIGPDGQETLVYGGDADALEGEFGVEAVRDEGETAPVLTTRDDRMSINIDLTNYMAEDLRVLDEGEDATVRITTQAGSEAVTILNTPQSLSSYDDGDAVEL